MWVLKISALRKKCQKHEGACKFLRTQTTDGAKEQLNFWASFASSQTIYTLAD
jgi:hypothetical protein